ncbi:MAG: DUF1343 domain-containing protein [Bacteroidales bacterium]|jgi:uncharacterized protein YbbC (DUF1343 family)|nr:DUF1343 domain-containing protein [Bacteroidales bacterium]
MKNILKNFLAVAITAALFVFSANVAAAQDDENDANVSVSSSWWRYDADIQPGACSVGDYIPLLRGKKVCLLSNQTGMINEKTHVVDTLVSLGIKVVCLMSPEHGFRGQADAGEQVGNSVDAKTGIPIRSLYGKSDLTTDQLMSGFDVVVFDLQDVGTRFYTYYVTMINMMAKCAKYDKEFIILDRPNPLGFYVDGPILDMKYKSGVGGLPIPVVYGMTLGELANMANEKGWLEGGVHCSLAVVKCKNYTHAKHYKLPVKPSPNLPNMRAVYLYPSLCYFEATKVSLGRGTDFPFQVYGSPEMKGFSFSFTPRSVPGAKNPPLLDKECFGEDLRLYPLTQEVNNRGIDLTYLINAYNASGKGDEFFSGWFEKLIGQRYVREMIEEGKSADEIKQRWSADDEQFIKERRPYLLYPEK